MAGSFLEHDWERVWSDGESLWLHRCRLCDTETEEVFPGVPNTNGAGVPEYCEEACTKRVMES